MRISKSFYSVFASVLGLATGIAAAAPMSSLLLTGRVEYVNGSEGVLYVLGHKIHSGDAKRVVKGQLVNVYGIISPNGAVVDGAQVESVSTYAVGADQIYVRGVISAVDVPAGVVYVGSTSIPISEISASGSTPRVGEAIGIFGTQVAASAPVVVRGAILSGSGERELILSGSGERESILSGSGERESILSGSGERESILSGSGERESILSGSGERESILSGSGERESILSGSGERESILSGSGERESILSGSGEREAILSGSGNSVQ
jgi:hypothetical protein